MYSLIGRFNSKSSLALAVLVTAGGTSAYLASRGNGVEHDLSRAVEVARTDRGHLNGAPVLNSANRSPSSLPTGLTFNAPSADVSALAFRRTLHAELGGRTVLDTAYAGTLQIRTLRRSAKETDFTVRLALDPETRGHLPPELRDVAVDLGFTVDGGGKISQFKTPSNASAPLASASTPQANAIAQFQRLVIDLLYASTFLETNDLQGEFSATWSAPTADAKEAGFVTSTKKKLRYEPGAAATAPRSAPMAEVLESESTLTWKDPARAGGTEFGAWIALTGSEKLRTGTGSDALTQTNGFEFRRIAPEEANTSRIAAEDYDRWTTLDPAATSTAGSNVSPRFAKWAELSPRLAKLSTLDAHARLRLFVDAIRSARGDPRTMSGLRDLLTRDLQARDRDTGSSMRRMLVGTLAAVPGDAAQAVLRDYYDAADQTGRHLVLTALTTASVPLTDTSRAFLEHVISAPLPPVAPAAAANAAGAASATAPAPAAPVAAAPTSPSDLIPSTTTPVPPAAPVLPVEAPSVTAARIAAISAAQTAADEAAALREAAALALGASIKRDPAGSGTPATVTLADLFRNARTTRDFALALDAAGNSGDVSLLPQIRAELTATEPTLREKAVFALRFASANLVGADVLAAFDDPEASVRRAAALAVRYQKESGDDVTPYAARAQTCVERETSPELRSQCRSLLP